ncbi:MAG: hypothetical protein ACFFEV_09210 [Candidatus Thorarchaeota archaeon]
MDFVTILIAFLLLIWRDEDPFIVNLLGNLMLIGLSVFVYFFFPWFFSKYGPDEFRERKLPDE